jgi:uncharacterized protein YkwD
MPGAGTADIAEVARIRVICLLALLALFACATASISYAVGAHAHRRARSHPAHCVKTVKVHIGTAYVLRRKTVRCRRRGVHHPASTHHKTQARKRPHRHSAPHRAAHRRAPGRRTSAADVNGQCTDTQLTPDSANVERVRAAILCLVNRERATSGEGALALNAAIENAAQSHTASMALGNYFDHVGPAGDTPVQRLRSAGYLHGSAGYEVGENIAWGTLWLSSPRAIVAAWMASPPHRANILNARFRDTAIGVSAHPPSSLAHGQSGGIYTQDFGVIITG